jgi:hypothetical protein
MFKHPLRVGFSFGLTSGVITALGVIVGLNSGTHSKIAVIGGLLSIAIADSFSDALGVHFSEESELKHANREIWLATLSTYLSKFIFTSIFAVPILLFELQKAVWVNLVMGFIILCLLCVKIAQEEKKPAWKVVLSHLLVTSLVILIINYLGHYVGLTFK